jgi:predicted metal-dependent peptidase
MANKTPSHGTGGGEQVVAAEKRPVDPARLAGFDMNDHLVALAWNEPFYADIIRSLTKIETKAIPTAGVVQEGAEIKMWWNREFCAGLVDMQVRGLLKHESLHLILLHTTARRYFPHWVWNWAADLAINSMIPEAELPECGLIPGKAFTALTAKQLGEMKPEQVARHQKLSALIASMPKGESGEWYFGKLMDDESIKEMEKERQDGEEAFKKMLEDLADAMGQGDSHEGWGDGEGVSEEERQLAEGKVRQILKEAQQKADKSNSWGSVPAGMQAQIRKLVNGEIPWQSILRQFVGFTHRQDRMETWTRSSKKDPMGQPGTTWSHRASIGAFLDQSGSVDDGQLELLFGELASLSRKAEFTLFHFDTEVDEKSRTVYRKGMMSMPYRTRCGGTDFDGPHDFFVKHRKEFDAMIILTDGGAPKPKSANYRRAWVVTPGNKLAFEPDSRDIVIQMTGKSAD